MAIKIVNPASSSSSTSSAVQNFIINGAFDYWQRVGNTNQPISAGNSEYRADRWYVVNNLDTGNMDFYRVAGTFDGSLYGCNVNIAVGASATSGDFEFWQVLDNQTTHSIYNKSVSFAIQIKALNNVTQIGIQLAYETTEAKPTNFYGSETLVTVNSSTFTLCEILNQAISTSPTAAGVVGIRIRPTAVSSGNIWDDSNGFIAEQAIINIGITAEAFQRAGLVAAEELELCQRFYAKTYEIDTRVQTVTSNGVLNTNPAGFALSTNVVQANWFPSVPMRTSPTITFYNPVTGGGGTWRDQGGADISVSIAFAPSEQSVNIANSAAMTVARYLFGHVVADAEI